MRTEAPYVLSAHTDCQCQLIQSNTRNGSTSTAVAGINYLSPGVGMRDNMDALQFARQLHRIPMPRTLSFDCPRGSH